MFVKELVMNLPRTSGFLIGYKNILSILSGEEHTLFMISEIYLITFQNHYNFLE
jgi:hypothetical protein